VLIPHAARLTLTVALVAAVIVASACGAAGRMAPAQKHPSPPATLASGPPARIAVLVMENQEYGSIIGSRDAPYVNRLAQTYGLVRGLYAVSHPSLPNYLALTGGSTFGINSDCTDCTIRATSLVDQLERAGVSWKAYLEGFPGSCYTGAGRGDYAKKHDPFAYYPGVTGDPARCGKLVPLSRLSVDERAGSLPRFSWIAPNLCHDMHDCSIGTGDRFLARLVPPLLAALGPRGLLVLTWDEGTSNNGCCRLASGGHVATIVAGGLASRGAVLTTPTDHYSILQTIEDLLALPRLRRAACACTPSLAPLLRR
jgi:phosphatidylinositol-3-phosphatase